MTYRLRYDKQFTRQAESLPGDIRSIAKRLINSLIDAPYPARVKELDGHPGHYRVHLPRDHRLIYRVLENEQIVDLLYIGPKLADLYTRLGLGRSTEDDE